MHVVVVHVYDVGEVIVCDVVWSVVVGDDKSVVRVEWDIDDNNASARCRVDGGLILGMIIVMGTEIRARFRSQNICLRDNHIA